MLPKNSFSISTAKISQKKETSKLSENGPHLCAVTYLREKFGYKGHGFWLGARVVAGPTEEGIEVEYSFYPENNRKPMGKLSADDVYQRELGKLVLMIASCAGLDSTQAGRLQDEHIPLFCQVLDKRQDGQYVMPDRVSPSPLTGRLIVIARKSYAKKDRSGNESGEVGSYVEYAPYSAAAFPQFRQAADAYTARFGSVVVPELGNLAVEDEEEPKAPPPAPKSKKAKQTFEQYMAANGFVVHPEDDDYAWNETTEEMVEGAELRARYEASLKA